MAQESSTVHRPATHRKKITLSERSCYDCNRRKVRCDKTSPCANCVRLGVECQFPPPGRKPRKTSQRSSHKEDLISRLLLLEREVQKLGGQGPTAPEPAPAELLEAQDRPRSPQSGRAVGSFLAKDVTAEHPTIGEDHDHQSHEPEQPNVTVPTLDEQFGQLVVDRNNGTSRYLSHRVLADLASQVNYAPRKHHLEVEQIC